MNCPACGTALTYEPMDAEYFCGNRDCGRLFVPLGASEIAGMYEKQTAEVERLREENRQLGVRVDAALATNKALRSEIDRLNWLLETTQALISDVY